LLSHGEIDLIEKRAGKIEQDGLIVRQRPFGIAGD
jgi:hypothetical protein